MLTLQGLKDISNVPQQGEKLPTAKQLREYGASNGTGKNGGRIRKYPFSRMAVRFTV